MTVQVGAALGFLVIRQAGSTPGASRRSSRRAILLSRFGTKKSQVSTSPRPADRNGSIEEVAIVGDQYGIVLYRSGSEQQIDLAAPAFGATLLSRFESSRRLGPSGPRLATT